MSSAIGQATRMIANYLNQIPKIGQQIAIQVLVNKTNELKCHIPTAEFKNIQDKARDVIRETGIAVEIFELAPKK